MLNYIWLGLIVLAICVAVGRDVTELSEDRFQNGSALTLEARPGDIVIAGPNHFTGKVFLTRAALAKHYGASEIRDLKKDTLFFPVDILSSEKTATTAAVATTTITLGDGAPQILTDLAAASGDATKLAGRTVLTSAPTQSVLVFPFVPQPIYFRVMAKVTNEGVLKIADTAVTLALGLIGVMTLWLGVMKIAEAAGLVLLLAKLVKPIMIRLFPEVPPEHPAMGAMVMNMTANFLGLSNAATPMGLKAMEELNKLNPHAGTATNAMCMFLTINTTALTLVPATVIAIRLTLGSRDPSEIIMPTFLATLFSLIIGVMFTRFIERFFPIPKDAPALAVEIPE
ncbi:MAG: nucleoside recognition domain-containing protein [Candidatus Kapaibacterium sp.]|jgi:spore maturation protein SpmA